MLKGINPLLTLELLKLLMGMGHDDSVVLADANFTAMSIAAGKPVLRLPGTGMVQAVQAVNSLLPLAADVVHPVCFMQVSSTHSPYLSELQPAVLESLAPDLLPGQSAKPQERFAFYDRARTAYAVILTGERQPFGNFILRKGIIGESL